MVPYWIIFSVGSLLALAGWPRSRDAINLGFGIALFLLLTLFIGFRFHVGADWHAYELIFFDVSSTGLDDALLIGDPSYSFLNWLVGLFGGDVWYVNLLCAILVVYALIRFCFMLPLPGLALVAAMPTLILVMAMGYTRQACAVSCLMLASCKFNGSFNWRWLVWLVIAVTFHKSAIFAFPAFVLAASKHRTANLVIGGLVGVILIAVLILENLTGLLSIYVEADLQSSGAAVRAALAIAPAAAFFLLKGREALLGDRYKLWRNMAYGSFLLLPMLVFISSSTIVDRIGLILVPFQIVCYSIIPVLLARNATERLFLIFSVIILNAGIFGIWLLYADHAGAWIPYRNILFEPFLY